MRVLMCALLAAAWMLGGCASHYALAPIAGLGSAGLINDPKQAGRLEKALTDGDIATLLDADIQAKLPTAVAIARLESRCSGYQPHLATIDAEELEAWEKCFDGQSLIRGVHPVSHLALGQESLNIHNLRKAAARMNCELLLVYLQGDSKVDNLNDAAALYWTFVGLWLVPGNVIEQRTVMQALLLDCRTGAILGTATGDSHHKRICPAAMTQISKDKLARQVPGEALADLQTGCKRLLANVVETALAASQTAG